MVICNKIVSEIQEYKSEYQKCIIKIRRLKHLFLEKNKEDITIISLIQKINNEKEYCLEHINRLYNLIYINDDDEE